MMFKTLTLTKAVSQRSKLIKSVLSDIRSYLDHYQSVEVVETFRGPKRVSYGSQNLSLFFRVYCQMETHFLAMDRYCQSELTTTEHLETIRLLTRARDHCSRMADQGYQGQGNSYIPLTHWFNQLCSRLG